jgi:hypothetical protein
MSTNIADLHLLVENLIIKNIIFFQYSLEKFDSSSFTEKILKEIFHISLFLRTR